MRAGYRAWGADLPFTDPRRAHGVAMEGYFWRLTEASSGRVVVALCGVCRDARGTWATVALAAHPGAVVHRADLPRAGADPDRLGVWAGDEDGRVAFYGDAQRLDVDLGPDAQLHVALQDDDGGPPWLGGSGVAQLVPGLSQYWHPHLLHGSASGVARLGSGRVALDGARAYAEKNWGAGGFPARWWWGQAHDFGGEDALAVAFAGGEVGVGPARLEATGVVVRWGDRLIRLGNPLLAPARVTADGARWSLHARAPIWSVALQGRAGDGDLCVLPVPDLAARRGVPAAHEHLAGTLSLVLRRRGRVVCAGESALAGLELGSVDELREQLGRAGG